MLPRKSFITSLFYLNRPLEIKKYSELFIIILLLPFVAMGTYIRQKCKY